VHPTSFPGSLWGRGERDLVNEVDVYRGGKDRRVYDRVATGTERNPRLFTDCKVIITDRAG